MTCVDLSESQLGVSPYENNGEIVYLGRMWGDNSAYLDKKAEKYMNAMSDVLGTAGDFPTVASPMLKAAANGLKAGALSKSDQKGKFVAEELGGMVGGKYAKAMGKAGSSPVVKDSLGDWGAEKIGQGVGKEAVKRAMGGQGAAEKKDEMSRRQQQRQHIKLLNGGD